MKDEVKDIFQNVNYWLSFAEAKNAALIGMDFALFDILRVPADLLFWQRFWLIFIYFCALIFPLMSFYPLLSTLNIKLKRTGSNLIYYRDVAAFNDAEYYELLVEKWGITETSEADVQIMKDYASEIVANSKIAVYKYTMFKVGLAFSILIFLIFLFSIG